jgi:hypothetical protein
METVSFCVVEKPYMLWGHSLADDNARFLKRIDADLYYRTAHKLVAEPDKGETCEDDPTYDDDEGRKDISSLSRLMWHHGVETLVMLLGAYMQAPQAVMGYFLKCKTEDTVEIGQLLLTDEQPKYSHLAGAPFTLLNLLNGIHDCARWPGSDTAQVVDRFARALRNMLGAFTRQEHRWEYNSVKHGLRASHGRFSLAVGLQETAGVPAPAAAMHTIGSSRNASFFEVAKPLLNATKEQSKLHFTTGRVTVPWSLEKVLMELQLISLLIGNTVSALQIANGAAPNTIKFNKVAEDDEFWEEYFRQESGNVTTASFRLNVDANDLNLPGEETIRATYKSAGEGD